jgi:poly-gamma-glutamate capsule biosynthesis protein CapA/YwtB (metallophosphatase superfamily)
VIGLLLGFSCSPPLPVEPAVEPIAVPIPEPEPPRGPVEAGRLRLVAGGDVLIHRRLKETARHRAASDGSEGFDWIFAPIAPLLSAADVAFVNLEVPVAPDSNRGVRGEVFNAPAAVIDALNVAGVDAVSFANNHTFDQGGVGLVETLTRLEDAGIVAAGSGRTCAEAEAAQRIEHDGVVLALLAVTDLMNLNDNTDPATPCTFAAGPVCTGDCGPDRDAIHYRIDEEKVLGAIRSAAVWSDAVVVSFHWGTEYTTTPLPLYTDLAPRLVEAGADIVLGHHPHVLQPIARHTATDGREGLILYSLGNLVSDMAATYSPIGSSIRRGNTRDGLLVGVTVVKTLEVDDTMTVELEGIEVTPLWTENNRLEGGPAAVRVVPLAAVEDEGLRAVRWGQVVGVVGEEWVSGWGVTGGATTTGGERSRGAGTQRKKYSPP